MSKAEWQRRDRAKFKREHGYSTNAHYRTGGLREKVLQRDGRKCVRCGMSDIEHKRIWDRPITLDHRDRNKRHNTLENLQTLCLVCHGSKDISFSLKVSKVEPLKAAILTLRAQGWSCTKIALKVNVGTRVITKWLRRWQNGRL